MDISTNKDSIVIHRPNHWKARLTISLILLALSFIGMIITDFVPALAWIYWSYMIPVFAILCLIISYLDTKKGKHISGVTVWHEILHWAALLVAVYLIAIFVHWGVMSNIVAGLFILISLALATFLAGIYIDVTFVFIGVLLGFFTLVSAFFMKYLFIITIPACIVIIALLFWLHKHKQAEEKQ